MVIHVIRKLLAVLNMTVGTGIRQHPGYGKGFGIPVWQAFGTGPEQKLFQRFLFLFSGDAGYEGSGAVSGKNRDRAGESVFPIEKRDFRHARLQRFLRNG